MSDTFFNPDLEVAPGGDPVRTMGGLAGFPDETFYAPTAARSREYTPLASSFDPTSYGYGGGAAPIFFANRQGMTTPSAAVSVAASPFAGESSDGAYEPAPGFSFQPLGPGQTVIGNQSGGTYTPQPGGGSPSTGSFSRDFEALMNTPGALDAILAVLSGPAGIPSVALGTALSAASGRPQVNTLGGALRNFLQDRALKTKEERQRQTETMEGLNRVQQQLGLDRSGIIVEDLPEPPPQQPEFQNISAPATGGLTAFDLGGGGVDSTNTDAPSEAPADAAPASMSQSDIDSLNARAESFEAITAANMATIDALNAAIAAAVAETASVKSDISSLSAPAAPTGLDRAVDALEEALGRVPTAELVDIDPPTLATAEEAPPAEAEDAPADAVAADTEDAPADAVAADTDADADADAAAADAAADADAAAGVAADAAAAAAADADAAAAAAQADADAAAADAAASDASDAGDGDGDGDGDGGDGDGGDGDGGDGGGGDGGGDGGGGDGGGGDGGGGDGGGYYQGGLVAFAQGGLIPLQGGGKIAIGPGGGLDDLIPTSIGGRRAAALSDGEFVIPADVVSMMGDGSSNAGSRRLYDLVKQIRQVKTNTTKQARPLPVGDILKRSLR